ncbi:MAG TPA: FkbM family methyltransferase [Chthoniobacteraceae bacterium]|nr:FkbM family methyltransferase [Chthoniobacteraceae bacterium]
MTIAVPWQDTTGVTVITFGDSEPDVFQLICSRLRERAAGQDLFVDVGANLGVFSLRVAERFPECQVIAFEPDPELATLLCHNARVHGLAEKIDLREVALGERDVEARLTTVAGDSGLSSLRSDGSVGIPVRVRRLATELTLAEWKRVAVMKIDVEGYELGVFRGAEPLFAQHLPVMVFEVNRPELRAHGVDPRELGDFLRRVGYEQLLALNGVLYPPENGLYEVCNLVALPTEARAFAGQHGFDPHFRPQPESMWPTVQYPV